MLNLNTVQEGVMNGSLKFLTARKILPLLDLLPKFNRVLACSCSPNFGQRNLDSPNPLVDKKNIHGI